MWITVEDDTNTTASGFEAPGGGATRILLIFGEDGPRAITLPQKDTLTIGRGAAADLRIEHGSLSRTHARLRFDTHITIEDLESSNGTFVGGLRLTPGRAVVVAPGGAIQLGAISAILHVGASRSPTLIASDGTDAGTLAVERIIQRIAQTDLSVLLVGETGVGKTTLARRLHDASHRSAGPFRLLGASNIESAARDGSLVTSAGDGTLVIQEPIKLGAESVQPIFDVLDAMPNPPRLATTSSCDVRAEVEDRRFPAELYHRLSGVSIVVPPLRERVHDIAALAQTIAADTARGLGRSAPVFAPDALAALERHSWPGNVRELASRIGSAIALSGSRVLTASHFQDLDVGAVFTPGKPRVARVEAGRGALREARERSEYQQIIEALRTTRGNQTQAAQALGISRSTLLARLEKYGVPRPRKP